jgi:hypothetical protein
MDTAIKIAGGLVAVVVGFLLKIAYDRWSSRLTCFVFFGQCCGLFWRVPGEPADVETAA